MKKLLFTTIISLLVTSIGSAQVDTTKTKIPANDLVEKLMVKSRKQNTAGWVFLVGGAALAGISFAVHPKDSDDFSTGVDKTIATSLLLVGGTGLMIGSLPFFIVSGVNKRKARILLQSDNVSVSPRFRASFRQIKTGITIQL